METVTHTRVYLYASNFGNERRYSLVEDAEAFSQLLFTFSLRILFHLAHHHDQELFEVDGTAACKTP